MKLGLLAASLLLVAGGAVGCGDDDGGGGGGGDKTASKADFCDAFQGFYDDVTSSGADDDDIVGTIKDAAQEIEDVGTPEGIPDDAKEGLQVTLDAIQDLPDDASAEDISALGSDVSDEDEDKADAFTKYLDDTCPDIGA